MDNINLSIELNKPMYLYQCPMFAITVSTVLLIDNGVLMIQKDDTLCFPFSMVRAGQETIQFASLRTVKEQTGVKLMKDALIPVDFRSDPSRSKEGNLVDIGFICLPNNLDPDKVVAEKDNLIWKEVDFENKKMIHASKLYMDHDVLLERALEIACMIKE